MNSLWLLRPTRNRTEKISSRTRPTSQSEAQLCCYSQVKFIECLISTGENRASLIIWTSTERPQCLDILTEKVFGVTIKLVGASLRGFVGAFDAKTNLAELLDRVSRGEKITITRHGVPAAMLVPVGETSAKMTHKEIVEGMRKLRKRIKPGKMNVRQMVEEGRRF